MEWNYMKSAKAVDFPKGTIFLFNVPGFQLFVVSRGYIIISKLPGVFGGHT